MHTVPNDGGGTPSFRKWSDVPARAFAPPIMHISALPTVSAFYN